MADAGTCGTGLPVPFDREIEFIQGDTWSEVWDVYETDCVTPFDFTGYSLEFKAETLSYGRDIIILTDASGVDASVAGKLTFLITSAQSEALSAGTFTYTFTVTYPNNNKETWSFGNFKIKRGLKE